MEIGIGPYYLSKYPGKAGADRMRAHGYEYLDFDWYANTEGELYSDDEADLVARTEAWRDRFAADGYKVRQIHGPWIFPVPNATPEEREYWFRRCSQALHAASIIGAKYMAIHPLMPFGVDKHTPEQAKQVLEINLDFFTRLAPLGEKYGVYLCLENMPFPDLPISSVNDIVRVVREVNNPYLQVCLDTGHANVVGPAPDAAVRIIGKDLLAILHVHGNDGLDDHHYVPHDPRDTVDWEAFSLALREIGFDGVVSLETSVKAPGASPEELERLEIALAVTAKAIAGN